MRNGTRASQLTEKVVRAGRRGPGELARVDDIRVHEKRSAERGGENVGGGMEAGSREAYLIRYKLSITTVR